METRKLSIEKISFISLFITLFLIPIFFIPASPVSADTAKTILLVAGSLIAFSLFLINIVKKGEFEFPAHKLLWGAVLIPLAMFLSAILSENAHISLLGYNLEIGTWAFITLGFALMFLASILFKTREKIFYAYTATLVAAGLLALFTLIKFFSPSSLSFGVFGSALQSPIGGITDIAVFFGAAAVLTVMAFEELALSKIAKAILTVFFLVSLFILMVSNIAVVWLMLLIFSFIYLIYIFSFRSPVASALDTGERRISYGSLALVLVSLLFFINPVVSSSGSHIGDYLANRFNVSNIQVGPSFSSTYQVSRPVLQQNPWFGSGPNTFDIDWQMHKPNGVNSTVFWNVAFPYGFGLLPTFMATTGFVGLVFWLAFFVLFVLLGLKTIFVKSGDKVSQFLTTSSFIFSLFLWVAAAVYVPAKAVLALAFVFTGIFIASAVQSGTVAKRTILFKNNSKFAFVAVLLLVGLLAGNVAFGYSAVRQSSASIYYGMAQLAANGGDVNGALVESAKAANLTGDDIYLSAVAQSSVAKANQLLNTQTDNPTKQKADFQTALTNSIAAAQAATKARPENYQNWVALGALYESLVPAPFSVQGAYDSAKAAYSQALKVNPTSPEPYYLLARLESVNGNVAGARTYLTQSLNIKNDYADAYYLSTQIEASQNNIPEAIKSAEALAFLQPNNAGVLFQLGLLKYSNSDYQGAAQALAQALNISPDYANAKYFFGLALNKLGQKDAAIKEFQDLLTTNPDNADLPKIIANIQGGKDPLAGLTKATTQTAKATPPIK